MNISPEKNINQQDEEGSNNEEDNEEEEGLEWENLELPEQPCSVDAAGQGSSLLESSSWSTLW